MYHILLVEDDLSFGNLLETFLIKKNYKVTLTSSLKQAKNKLDDVVFDLVLSDMRLPDSEDLEIISYLKSKGDTPIIMITGYAVVNLAVKAIQLGAIDYLEKPIQPATLLSVIEKALSFPKKEITSNKKTTTEEFRSNVNFIKGNSETSKKLHQYIELVAPTPMSVLIIGESGTGKENIAKTIHNLSNRSNKPFVAVDCGAVPKEIASSEFFGHIKGSFTGAINDKEGHFSAANGGTLFLDEIGNLSYELQVQLLRAIQERKIRPVGSNKEIAVDIRIISATNSDLNQESIQGNFREDLLHRLNEFSIQVPALKDRVADLMIFANYFIEKANCELNAKCIGLDDLASKVFKNYAWPGNLRELQNVVKRAVLLSQDSDFISIHHLPEYFVGTEQITEISPLKNDKSEVDKIEQTLQLTNGNKAKTAKLLQIDRKTLYNKLKKYDIKL